MGKNKERYPTRGMAIHFYSKVERISVRHEKNSFFPEVGGARPSRKNESLIEGIENETGRAETRGATGGAETRNAPGEITLMTTTTTRTWSHTMK